jgi:hypothetical protein
MAKSDESAQENISDAERMRQAVENAAEVEDESQEDTQEEEVDENAEEAEGDDAEGEDTEESDDDDSEEESDDDEEVEDPKTAKVPSELLRYTQFAPDGKVETYLANINKAYEHSSAEGIRLNQELGTATRRFDAIMHAVAKDSDLANKLYAAIEAYGKGDSGAKGGEEGKSSDQSRGDGKVDPTVDPFLSDAKAKWQEQSTKEATEFARKYPQVLSDPEINKQVKHWTNVFTEQHYRATGQLLSAGKALEQAARHLGLESTEKTQKLAKNAKKVAAPSRPQGPRKPKQSAGKVSDEAVKFGQMMGVSRDKLEKFAQ